MLFLGTALSLPFIALALALAALPVWLAAKVLGAGRQGFWRAALALVTATALSLVVMVFAGLWSLVLVPAVFVVVFAKLLEMSYTGAFVLCILALAFQAVINKVFAAF
ncbi:MAG: hypothetical protein EOP35_19270 [Rubrivivax sp.]|nr:MAG: hypothetical protein EOP35_19270 [Rubrivivax sp.]